MPWRRFNSNLSGVLVGREIPEHGPHRQSIRPACCRPAKSAPIVTASGGARGGYGLAPAAYPVMSCASKVNHSGQTRQACPRRLTRGWSPGQRLVVGRGDACNPRRAVHCDAPLSVWRGVPTEASATPEARGIRGTPRRIELRRWGSLAAAEVMQVTRRGVDPQELDVQGRETTLR